MVTYLFRGLLVMALWLLGTVGAHAEGGFCPPGSYDPNNGSAPAIVCVPIAGGQQLRPQPPAQQWERRWGAVAIDSTKAVMGVATHMQSEQDASKVAMLDCQLKGGGNCKIEATYDNQCVAVVTGDSGHNAPNAATVARATEIGMKTCRDSGDTNCRVYYSACSLPVRIR